MPPADPLVRVARRADLPAIMALLADDPFSVGREDGPTPDVEAAFTEIEAHPGTAMHVLEQGGRIVGCAQLTVVPGVARRALKRGIIEAVRVASDLRGQGLGRTFIRTLIEEARRAGCGVVQLTSDKRRSDAHRFYQGLGFAMSHDGFKLLL